MAGVDQEVEVNGFEEGISWLPSHVADEAIWDSKKRSQSSPRPFYNRKRNPVNWASGGPGMQAIFLHSGKKSCGTGVYLPTSGGTNAPVSKKPACSAVLLPARIVQALNINVHENRRQDAKKNSSRNAEFKSARNKTRKDASRWNENASPDIFLPKEWTY